MLAFFRFHVIDTARACIIRISSLHVWMLGYYRSCCAAVYTAMHDDNRATHVQIICPMPVYVKFQRSQYSCT